jgi:NPCBM/NEW2 domain
MRFDPENDCPMLRQPRGAGRPRQCIRTSVCALALTLLFPAAPATADDPVASDPVFTALTTDGQTVSGRIRQFGQKGEITLVTAAGPERVMPLESLVKLARVGSGPPMTPEAMVVLFPDGDRLHRSAIAGATETALDVQPYSLGTLSIPLDSLLGLVFTLPPDAEAVDALVRRVRDEPRNSEVLWLANNDRLNVGFLGLSDKSIDFKSGQKAEKIDRSRVIALGFDPALVVYPRPQAGFVELTLADGSRLGVVGARLEQGHVVATTRFGAKVRIAVAEVFRIHARTPAVTYLAERTPARQRYVPYVGPARPFRRDATVEGHPFRMGGQEFDRGIGTTSRTLLAYRLEKGDRRFQAAVGVDDRAGPLGNVVFRVLVDTREAFASPPMAAGDPARAVDVDLGGGGVLVLITEFGERGDVRDIADWVEARIIR